MLKAKLVVVGGDAKAAEISLSLPTVIGRGRDASLTLPHPLVSRQHCELFEKEGMLHVRDMKSLNGTYVDSQRIEASSLLKPDQLLTIGNVTFRAIYSADDASIADPAPNTSNVIEFDEVESSADSDSKLDHGELESNEAVHSRPTVHKSGATEVPGDSSSDESRPNNDLDVLKTVTAEELAAQFDQSSDVLDDGQESGQTPSAPQHSIVAALQNAGLAEHVPDDASISDIMSQLPNETRRPETGNIEELEVEPMDRPAKRVDFSSINLDEQAADRVEADESALGSFIRNLPR